ncbi:Short-chain dehydrogenase TIC 32, chloroplastic [Daldinia childiae]|uniref:Short-chain dehydrogenase TIC 32, chloroplastic n=1 Tax=Daldinia childiae TaxID=326645 RepID=UPI0014475C2A|nr:Short-chain dehydrogenase TIC 32, chloroplastic [Daldinia childiae]KAF3065788.1 Short-chain dehydrogenase TIC 32, chloroplastic [Daldinia childiae]
MSATFDVSPEKEGSILNYFYRQLTQTPAQVRGVDLSGKTAIVTGSNIGIGRECGRQLLDLGLTKLILAVRNVSKGQATAAELSESRNLDQGTIEVWELDYASYDSIRSFVERAKGLEHLHIVILNAGIMTTEVKINPNTGHEETIQTNYLSTALLTVLLLPVIKSKGLTAQQPGRITITSSDTAAWAKLDESNQEPLLPSFDKPGKVDMLNRTFVSKLLGQLFLVELAKHVPSSVAVINTATPMMVYDSGISRDTSRSLQGKIAEVFRRRIGYTSAVGARMIVDAAVKHGEETHGQYLGLQELKPMAPIVYTPKGEQLRNILWKETLQEFSFAGVKDILKEISSG